MRERIRLASTRAGDDEQRTGLDSLVVGQWLAEAHRFALWAVQLLEM